MSKCTEAELEKIMAQAEYKGHTAVRVYEEGENLVAYHEGRKIVASNAFLLDSTLTDAGVPQPRNLFLMADR